MAIVAGGVASVSGFGIGSLLTPVLLLSLDAGEAVAVVAIPHALATAVRWVRLRADVHRPTFREFGLASGVGGLTGAALQSQLASPALTFVLGALLVIAGAKELARLQPALPATPSWRLAGGLLSGLFGGLVGNQGGIRAAALLGFRLTPRQIVATATATALLVDAARLPIYIWWSGPAMLAHAGTGALASTGVVIGTLVGVPLLGRIPETVYRPLLGGLLVALGLGLLITSTIEMRGAFLLFIPLCQLAANRLTERLSIGQQFL